MAVAIQLYNKDGAKAYAAPYWPIGSIYLSVVKTNPSTWFGGTWNLIAQGRTLVGVNTNDGDFSSVEKVGGSKTHTHSQGNSGSTVLSINQIPNHNHSIHVAGTRLDANGDTVFRAQIYTPTSGGDFWNIGLARTGLGTHNAGITSTGGGEGHTHTNPNTNSSSSLQPYFTCYIWKRTA